MALAGMLLCRFEPVRRRTAALRRLATKDPQPAKATLALVGGHAHRRARGATRATCAHPDRRQSHRRCRHEGHAHGPARDGVVDAGGMTVMPGLIDAHVHMDTIGHTDYRVLHQTYRNRIQDIYAIPSRNMLFSGVITALDLLAESPKTMVAYKKKLERGAETGVRPKSRSASSRTTSDSYIPTWHRGYQTINASTRLSETARAAAKMPHRGWS